MEVVAALGVEDVNPDLLLGTKRLQLVGVGAGGLKEHHQGIEAAGESLL